MTEFDDVIRRLEDGRPQASARELDDIKQRVRRRAASPSRKGNQSMKSRFAILAMLVTGMLFSTAGAGLAVQGLAQNDDAAVAQYATPTPQGAVLPSQQENAPAESPETDGGVQAEGEDSPEQSGGVRGADEGPTPTVQGADEASTPTQPERQIAAAAETSQLPLTGFAAIPVLVGGLALLLGGLLLRRRTGSQ